MKTKKIKNRGDVMKFAGVWKDVSDKDINHIKKIIKRLRKQIMQ